MSHMDTYRAKRAKFVKIIYGCFFVFFCSVVVGLFATDHELIIFAVGFMAMVMAVTCQMTLNTCPSCGKAQFGAIRIRGSLLRTRGWALNPMKCPWCGVQLGNPRKHV